MNKFWSILNVEEKTNQQRKGVVVSYTVSQSDQQARPNQCGAGDKTWQDQDQDVVDKAEP